MFHTRLNPFVGALGLCLVLGVTAGAFAAASAHSPARVAPPLSHALIPQPAAAVQPPAPAPSWKERATFKHSAAVKVITFGENDIVFAGDEEGTVIAWNVRKEEKTQTCTGRPGDPPIDALALHPDGKWLYVVNRKQLTQINLERRFGHGQGGFKVLGFTRDGRTMIHADPTDATKLIFRAHEFPKAKGAVPADIKHKADVAMIAACDEPILATVTTDNTLSAWDTAKNKLLWSVTVDKLEATALAISPSGEQVAVAGKDGVVRQFDGRTGKLLHQLKGHTGAVYAVAFSDSKAKKLATAGADKTVRVWNSDSGDEIAVLSGHTAAVRCVLITSDSQFIVSGSADKTVKIWEMKP